MIDGHGRTIDKLRVSVTDRCDLRCVYCMPFRGVSLVRKEGVLTYDEIAEVVRFLAENAGLRRVRITGGEPLVRPDIPALVEKLARVGIDDLSMTTNAQLLAPAAKALASAGLGRVNISLDSLRADRFRKLARTGRLERTLEGIDAAIDAGLSPVKLNTVVIAGENDDEIVDIFRFAADRGAEARFLELMEIGEALPLHPHGFFSMEEALGRLGEEFQVEEMPVRRGSTAVEYRLTDGNGTDGIAGLIAPVTRPFCSDCGRLRLSATGLLRGCLMNQGGVDVKPALRAGGDRASALGDALRRAVMQKPWMSGMKNDVGMNALGG